nr:AAA family ATPase [Yoonia sp.]
MSGAQPRFVLRHASDAQKVQTARYLVKGWLGSTGLSVVYGESNSGKSFFAIDFGFHVAAGEPWQGRLVKQGRVLLLAAEGAAGIPNRLKAIKLANPEFSSRAESNFSYITGQFDLRSDTHREEICALVRDQPPALLIIDTLALTFGDGLENEAGDMAQYVKQVSALGAPFNCHVMLIHHPGKDASRGMRGSSVLRAAIDTEIIIETNARHGIRTAKITKQREGATGQTVGFELEVVELGTDEDGDPITSCVVVPISATSTQRRKVPTGNAKAALQALHDALEAHGRQVPHFPAATGNAVEKSTWYEAFLANQGNKNLKSESSRKNFKRAATWLEENGYIETQGEYVWVSSADKDNDGHVPDMSDKFATD